MVRPYSVASGAIDGSIMALIMRVHITRNETKDMPIVPGIPHSPIPILIAHATVTSQQIMLIPWMTDRNRPR